MYTVAIFDTENAAEGVPSKWVKNIGNEFYCFWPSKMKREKLAKLIKDNAFPAPTWQLLKCRIKCEAASYEEMKIKVKEAEIVSSQEVSDSDSESVSENSNLQEVSCATPSPPHKKRKGK